MGTRPRFGRHGETGEAQRKLKKTHRRNGVPKLDHLELFFRILTPHSHRPVIARTRDQAPPGPSPLHIDRVDDALVPPEPPEDFSRLEPKQEDGVVAAAGDERCRRRVGDRRRGPLAQPQDSVTVFTGGTIVQHRAESWENGLESTYF